VLKKHLTDKQIEDIKNYQNVALGMTKKVLDAEGYRDCSYRVWLTDPDGTPRNFDDAEEIEYASGTFFDDFWDIIETESEVSGRTNIDNFDFYNFLLRLGVPREHIKYEDWGG
jgi:hypothetical protein